MKRTFWTGALLLSAVIILTAFRQQDDLFELRKNFEIFGAVYEEIAVGYVNDVRPTPFMRAGIEAMLSQLDPYTQFYDEADVLDARLLLQRNLGGVGLSIGIRGGRLSVVAPEGDASAYRAGIRPGDEILRVGETDVTGLTPGEVNELLIGQPGTVVDVEIHRPGEVANRTFRLPRIKPRTENVSFSGWLGPDSTDAIAYVRLDQFGNRAGREVKRAFRTLHRLTPLEGMVLDLRGNPGGILAEAISTVGNFVPEGSVVVSTRSRADDSVQSYRTEGEPLFPDVPLVILMDEYSASASEIVAGALQDMDRAVVLGATSLGKGLVQIVRPLPHNTSLKMTISHYFLPTGRTIQSARFSSESSTVTVPTLLDFQTPAGRLVRGGRGVEPDVPATSAGDDPIEAALRQESAFFLFANEWVANGCSLEATCAAYPNSLSQSFLSWIDEQGVALTTDMDLALLEIELDAVDQGYTPLEGPLAEFRDALNATKRQRLADSADRLTVHLKAEIRVRLLQDEQATATGLEEDPWVKQALDLVQDRSALARLLR